MLTRAGMPGGTGRVEIEVTFAEGFFFREGRRFLSRLVHGDPPKLLISTQASHDEQVEILRVVVRHLRVHPVIPRRLSGAPTP